MTANIVRVVRVGLETAPAEQRVVTCIPSRSVRKRGLPIVTGTCCEYAINPSKTSVSDDRAQTGTGHAQSADAWSGVLIEKRGGRNRRPAT